MCLLSEVQSAGIWTEDFGEDEVLRFAQDDDSIFNLR